MFYERFIQLCKNSNVKPSPLLESLGLTNANLKRWRNGSSPTANNAKLIADYFGVSIDYLIGNTTKPENINISPDDAFSIYADNAQLSDESRKQLLEYANLLKIRDMQKRNSEIADEFIVTDTNA